MPVHYNPTSLAEVRVNLDWQLGTDRDSVIDAAEHAMRTKWQDAAHRLCEGQEHNPPVQVLYLRYFPYAIRYAGQLASKGVHIHDPEFELTPAGPRFSPAAVRAVQDGINWQFGANRDSITDARDNANRGDWHDAAYDLCHGQRHNADAMVMYLRYFPVAMRHAASVLGVGIDIHDPDLVSVNGRVLTSVQLIE